MPHVLSAAELQTISEWENKLPFKFDPAHVDHNVDIVVGTAANKFGRITKENLDAAVQITLPALKFLPGHEPAAIKQQLAKAAQQKKDSEELEKKRKRDAQVQAGIGPNQSKIKTEFDRENEEDTRRSSVVSLTGVNSPSFLRQNVENQALFEDLVVRGPITYRRNREDRGKTEERRAELRAIKVVARQRDSKGQEVLIYSKMVEEAQQRIARFESEDSRREQS